MPEPQQATEYECAMPAGADSHELEQMDDHSRRACSADGLKIVEVWQTRRHVDYFFAREIRPAIDRLGMPMPDVTTSEVHRYPTQVPPVAIDSEDVCGDGESSLR